MDAPNRLAPKPPPRWRRLRPWFGGAAAVGTGSTLVLLALAWDALGAAPIGPRLERMRASRQWAGRGFENPLPLWNDVWGSVTGFLKKSRFASPDGPLPVLAVTPDRFATPPASGLRVTWLGHSTTLIEIDGARFLTDPVWGPRTSPLSFVGPERWYAPPAALEDLPRLDAVVISHDHYDHLDAPTIRRLAGTGVRFVVPLGVGAHLEAWGVAPDRITELDWWEAIEVAGVRLVATPARHASGRHVLDQNRTLWAGYAFVGPTRRAFFSGDTGMFPEFADIGARFGPFDVTMIEIGAYGAAWPDWHIGPEQALEAHRMLRGRSFIPIHWGLFDLAMHGWTEPIERVQAAAERYEVRALTPRPGESLEPTTAETARWWPSVPWQTETELPIRATRLPEPRPPLPPVEAL